MTREDMDALPRWRFFKHSNETVSHYRTLNPVGRTVGTAVFIQGMASSSHVCFKLLVDAFNNAGYRVLQYDLLGRGRSSASLKSRYSPDVFCNQLRDLIAYTGLDGTNHVLVGYSLGGGIAALMEKDMAAVFSNLIFIGPVGVCCRVPRQLPRWISTFVLRHMCWILKLGQRLVAFRATRGEFFDKTRREIRQIALNLKMQARRGREFYEAMYNTTQQFPFNGLRPVFEELSRSSAARMMVILSGRDRKVPFLENARFFYALFGGTRHQLIEFPDAGHWALVEQGDAFAALMLDFCSRTSTESYADKAHPYWAKSA